LVIAVASAGADPLGLTVGVDFGLGNVAADHYNFAGKADPVSGEPAGMGSIVPYISYNKTINNFLISVYLSETFGLNNPQTALFEGIVTGGYNFILNNNLSIITVTVENIFKLNTYDWKTKVSDGAGSWENLVIPSGRFTQVLGFGSVYGKFDLPIYFDDIEKAYGLSEYETHFIFADAQVGVIINFGLQVYLRSLFQLFPDVDKASAPYNTYNADIPLKQIDLGFGYTDGPLSCSLVFGFPIYGHALGGLPPNYIKESTGFKIEPSVSYRITDRMQASLKFEILNIGKDTSNPVNDKVIISPTVGFSYDF
jgi:hypothetical protein